MTFTIEKTDQALQGLASKEGFDDGYHLLYCPWAMMDAANVAFISLNPGRASSVIDKCKVHEPRGNSYVLERKTTLSPFTAQYLELSSLINLDLNKTLTGTYFPFRSLRWSDLSKRQIQVGLEFASGFWSAALKDCNLIITTGSLVKKQLVSQLGLIPSETLNSGWGNAKISTFKSSLDNKCLVALPHLSRYKLLSNSTARTVLEKVLRPLVLKL